MWSCSQFQNVLVASLETAHFRIYSTQSYHRAVIALTNTQGQVAHLCFSTDELFSLEYDLGLRFQKFGWE